MSKPCVEQLVGYMLGGGNPLTVGVGIVIEVIRKNNSDYDPDVGAESNAVPSSRDPIYLGTLLRHFADNVPNFMSLIIDGPSRKQGLASTFGEKLEPLGFDRFKTCELMAELLHCSNMGLLNEVGSEQLIEARDAERQRLRIEGKLGPQREEEHSTDDLTMRMPHTSTDEGRRLEVTNADEDGFEEVEPSKEMSEDTSHEFVKAEVDMAAPPAVSFLEKDEDDFVDEPLSSPRLTVAADKMTEQQFEDPDLVVAPLSPAKNKPAETAQQSATEPPPEQADVSAGKAADEATKPEVSLNVPSSLEPEVKADSSGVVPQGPLSSTDGALSPHPEDLPAPLFSASSSASAPGKATAEQAPAATTDASFESSKAEANEASAAKDDSTAAPEAQQNEETGPVEPVVGDYLKTQFVEHRVVPAILVS